MHINYREKVTIPKDKGFIYVQGGGIEKTIIAYDDNQSTDTSPTFTALPDNIIISGITIKVCLQIFFICLPFDCLRNS